MYIFGQYLDEAAISVCMCLVCWTLAQVLYIAAAWDIVKFGVFKNIALLIFGIAVVQYNIRMLEINNDMGLFLVIIDIFVILIGLTTLLSSIKQRRNTVIMNLRPGDYTVFFERQMADVQYPLTVEEQQEGHSCLTQIRNGYNVILTGLVEVNPKKDRLKLLCKYRSTGYDNLEYWDCIRVVKAGSMIPIKSLIRMITFSLLMVVAQLITAVIYLGSTGEVYVSSSIITELYKAVFIMVGYMTVYIFWYATKNIYPKASKFLSILKWILICVLLYQILQIV